MTDYSKEDYLMSICKHREYHTDDDLFPQAICVDCGNSIQLNPFETEYTWTSSSKPRIYEGFWSEDFQFIYEDCTDMTLEEYNRRWESR
jgi:hypothetical protein